MSFFRRKPAEPRPRRRPPWIALALAASVFVALALFMRSLERSAVHAALINDQLLPGGKARPVAEVAQLIRSMKLVTVEVATSVTSETSSDNWRGAVSARVTAPVRLLYGVDLSRLRTSNLSYSGVEHAWLLRVPVPQRIATEVCTDSEQTLVEVGWLRLRSRAGEYYLGLARRDLSERAREIALKPEDAAFVRTTSHEQLIALVRKLVGEKAEVLVRFDDPPPTAEVAP